MKLVECNLPCKFGRKALPKIPKEKMQTEPINDVNDGAKHDVQGYIWGFFPKKYCFFSDNAAVDESAKPESDGTKNDWAENVGFWKWKVSDLNCIEEKSWKSKLENV